MWNITANPTSHNYDNIKQQFRTRQLHIMKFVKWLPMIKQHSGKEKHIKNIVENAVGVRTANNVT